jgi:tRNA1Val (adenine37-N6)-methyltransferase
MFPPQELSDDGFLGQRLRILQPRAGYRAATDPVLLAAAVPALPGHSVLELGCGAGVASLCLAARVQGLHLTGLERQPAYAALARQNAARNGIALTVVEGDLAAMPPALRQLQFHHAIANPPFFAANDGTKADDPGREAAQREDTPLSLWIDAATRRLAPGGWLTLIHHAPRLPALLAALDARLGSVAVLPLAARADRAAGRVIVRARKGGRAPFRLLAPLILHQGDAHGADGDSFTPLAQAVLRQGAGLEARFA